MSLTFSLVSAELLMISSIFNCCCLLGVSTRRHYLQARLKLFDHRYQSYLARGGPSWLSSYLLSEAQVVLLLPRIRSNRKCRSPQMVYAYDLLPLIRS
ncbi:unnamed protein product, partial [Brassica rapa]